MFLSADLMKTFAHFLELIFRLLLYAKISLIVSGIMFQVINRLIYKHFQAVMSHTFLSHITLCLLKMPRLDIY